LALAGKKKRRALAAKKSGGGGGGGPHCVRGWELKNETTTEERRLRGKGFD